MLFNSIDFIIFFPTVVIIYFLLPHKWRWILLLVASCYFYMSFKAFYILLLMSTVVVDYFMGALIEKSRDSKNGSAKVYLAIGVIFPLLILFIFKYFNFFNTTVADIASLFHLNYSPKILNLLLPVGISFYTFQSLSYVIEVYRGNQKAETNFGIFTVYVMFFPQLVAGPIERPQNLLKQFYEKHSFDYQRIASGLKLMAWGFFKKLVIADRAAIIVNEIYNSAQDYWGIYLLVGTIFFSFQVYCDFSGYSDIAIGAARIIGFRLMTNFKRPYFATSINELWGRWHISLISWFRDYLYIPMGGSRVAYWRWHYNILVMFIVSGIWHGANWTFVIWSALNGIYTIISILTEKFRQRITKLLGLVKIPTIHKIMRILITFTLFTFAAIFFRANTVTDAFYIVTHLFTDMDKFLSVLVTLDYEQLRNFLVVPGKTTIMGFSKPAFIPEIITLILAISVMLIIQTVQERSGIEDVTANKPWYIRWPLYYFMMFSLLFLGIFSNQQFIYFQF